jgi:spore maturation protein CgeB
MKWYRRDIIKEIAEHREIHLYGDTAWRYLEENSKAVYHGKVYDIDTVVKIYNASKINIAVQSNVYNTGVNYRTFTIPACGGFMISDYRSELVELFEENKEVVHFRERGELIDLINYYLKHPKEREEIAQRARERVLREHTHRHRMGRILEVMKEVV